MYSYNRTRAISNGALFYIVFFILVFIGMGYLLIVDKGKFWDLLPFFCIPSIVINLILLIFYFVKRSVSGYIFTLFFLLFTAGLVVSSFFGPYSLSSSAAENYENENYPEAAKEYGVLLEKFPSSKYAEEALKKLPYCYYLNGDYEETVYYLEKAIEEKTINPDELEIKKIFAQSYMKIAEAFSSQGNLEKAVSAYRQSIAYLEQIEEDYPDTNDAFIAKYKIPEYLLNTADMLKRKGLWDDTIEVLQRVVKEYPDSDFYTKAYDMLFRTYISRAVALKKANDYPGSVTGFFKVYEIPPEFLESKKIEMNIMGDYILSGVPAGAIISAADELFSQSKFEEAMIIYDYILNEFPEKEPDIVENVVKTKINLTTNMEYETMPPAEPVGSFAESGTSMILFDNKTEYGLTIYIGGPQYWIIRLAPQTREELELLQGDYEIVAEFDAQDAAARYGERTYEDGQRYREIFRIEETGSN